MRRSAIWAHVILLASALAAAGQENNEALRKQLKDVDLVGSWIYDDIDRGFAEAKRTKKPLLVIFR